MKAIVKKILILFLSALVVNLYGQSIVAGSYSSMDRYFDVSPDTLIYATYPCFSREYNIDLNGDLISDFVVKGEICSGIGGGSRQCRIYTKNNNQVAYGYTDSCYGYTSPPTPPFPPPSFLFSKKMAYKYSSGEVIDNSAAWESDTMLHLAYDSFIGGQYNCNDNAFSDSVSIYIGVRVFLAGDTLYGWIKVRDVTISSVVIEEYACNSGQTGIADQYKENGLKIFPNPVSDELHIILKNKTGILKIYNSSSQLVLEKEIAGLTESSIDVKQFPSGFYYVTFQTEQNIFKVKFIITK